MPCLSCSWNAAELHLIGRKRRQNRMCVRLQGLGQDSTALHLLIYSILHPTQVWCCLLYSQRARFCHSRRGIESENFSIIELVWTLEKGYLLLPSIIPIKKMRSTKAGLKQSWQPSLLHYISNEDPRGDYLPRLKHSGLDSQFNKY